MKDSLTENIIYNFSRLEEKMKDNKKSDLLKRIKLFNKKFFGLTPFLFFLCLILMPPVIVQAASVTLTWNRNQEPDIAGYKIFYGTRSRQYTNSITVYDSANQPLQRKYTVAGLSEGTTYYLALKTFDQAGQESVYSGETSQNIPGAEDSQSTESVPGDCLINGTIEDGFSEPFGWELYDWVPPGQESNLNPGLWTSQEVHSGAFSLMVNNKTGSRVGWKGEQVRFAEPYPRTLTFGGWSKALDVDPDNWIYGLIFKICFADGRYTWFYPDAIQFDPGTHDWQLRQVTKTWDRAVVAVKPYAVLYDGTGTVWFDDIFVQVN
ncbi:fibronectin type III domain-containing protein [bacterium]|nr:fibronectin type III domain-containing protein [bacterium]